MIGHISPHISDLYKACLSSNLSKILTPAYVTTCYMYVEQSIEWVNTVNRHTIFYSSVRKSYGVCEILNFTHFYNRKGDTKYIYIYNMVKVLLSVCRCN